MGFVMLLGFLAYGLLTIVLMVVGGKIAKRYGKPADLVWIIVFFTSFLFVFWDTVPTVMVHNHYCEQDYGFREFKSLEQWKQENPGVAETLVPIERDNREMIEGREFLHLNARFDWQREYRNVFLSVRKRIEQLVDIETGEVLAEYVEYTAGRHIMRGGLLAYKFWLFKPSCYAAGTRNDGLEFNRFWGKAYQLGE